MATNFPSSLDTSTTLPAEGASTPLATNHVTAHQNIQDAIEAIEAKVGADSSAVTSSHDYKLSEVTSTDKSVGKTAAQTLTNKTLGTSTAITLGSDAEGDTYYRNASGVLVRLPRGSDNQIMKMNGNVPNWEAEASISNATTTTAGISELATAAEITAGTATGGSGAPLVVTPDALASSAPTFSGANLTGVIKISSDYHFSTVSAASANPRGNYSDAASSTISAAQTTYTKFKEIEYKDVAGTITATWSVTLVSGGTGTIYTKIYKNGVAVGAEKTSSGAQTESTISVSPNDLIQVYAHMTGGDTATYNVNTFRLNYDKTTTIVSDYTTNTANL